MGRLVEEREIKKLNRKIKVLMWLYIMTAILSIIAIVMTLMGIGINAANLLCANITILMHSLISILTCVYLKIGYK